MVARKSVTHFLRTPLATSKSLPQLLKTLEQIAQDPTTRALPRAAWHSPHQLHVTIASLHLETPSKIEAAIQLLRSLNLSQIAKCVHASSVDNPPTQMNVSEPYNHDRRGSIKSPVVALHGLVASKKWQNHPTFSLRCQVTEPKPFLPQFRVLLEHIFARAGLISYAPDTRSRPTACKIMDTSYLRSEKLKDRLGLKGWGYYQIPLFDASDVHLQYTNYPFTNDFPLEKLCISELGLKDVYVEGQKISTGYRDIACVPFPDMVLAESADEVYVKAAKTIKKDQSFMSPLIPSMPAS